jgi:hypothetical protein
MILHGKFRKVRPDMGGKIAHAPTFTALIKLRGIIWRFLDAPAKIVTKLKAQISSSHGEDGSFTESIQLHRQANASHHTAKATAAGKSVQGKLLANFVSYRRAALVYVKRIEARLLGKMQSAAGKAATSIRKVTSRLLVLLACALAKVLHLGNMIHTAAASKLDTSGIKAVTAARAMRNETGINPANVAGIAVNVSPVAVAAHMATLTTFAEPEPGADDILPEQQLTFKKNHGGYTNSYGADATLSIALVEGASYIIEWDGKLYGSVARFARWEAQNIGVYEGTCLGDMKNIPKFFFLDTIIHEDRGEGNNEPFFICAVSGKTSAGIETLDTSATHTVRIYVEQ